MAPQFQYPPSDPSLIPNLILEGGQQQAQTVRTLADIAARSREQQAQAWSGALVNGASTFASLFDPAKRAQAQLTALQLTAEKLRVDQAQKAASDDARARQIIADHFNPGSAQPPGVPVAGPSGATVPAVSAGGAQAEPDEDALPVGPDQGEAGSMAGLSTGPAAPGQAQAAVPSGGQTPTSAAAPPAPVDPWGVIPKLQAAGLSDHATVYAKALADQIKGQADGIASGLKNHLDEMSAAASLYVGVTDQKSFDDADAALPHVVPDQALVAYIRSQLGPQYDASKIQALQRSAMSETERLTSDRDAVTAFASDVANTKNLTDIDQIRQTMGQSLIQHGANMLAHARTDDGGKDYAAKYQIIAAADPHAASVFMPTYSPAAVAQARGIAMGPTAEGEQANVAEANRIRALNEARLAALTPAPGADNPAYPQIIRNWVNTLVAEPGATRVSVTDKIRQYLPTIVQEHPKFDPKLVEADLTGAFGPTSASAAATQAGFSALAGGRAPGAAPDEGETAPPPATSAPAAAASGSSAAASASITDTKRTAPAPAAGAPAAPASQPSAVTPSKPITNDAISAAKTDIAGYLEDPKADPKAVNAKIYARLAQFLSEHGLPSDNANITAFLDNPANATAFGLVIKKSQ